ncbi:hypothetical protein PR003_g10154 [Phytophthora rubi]|uniref:C2H2-type domain-containing protein n=1 Tax=Phytophthora rubi TaxID=129364 RepID=A0A6A3N2Y9_9STRA|nr:hypothetical protein PR001_g9645 [Phytophthora rubi]KAE9341127.1 hypothetical protein PR003_g10154 [Phytophthora rubi]
MPRRTKTCPKCKKRFATHGNMKRHQDKVFACGAQFVKQRKELAKRKKAYRNRYDYLKRVGRLHEYQGPLPPFEAPPPAHTPATLDTSHNHERRIVAQRAYNRRSHHCIDLRKRKSLRATIRGSISIG